MVGRSARVGDIDIYKSGFKSQALARAALTELAVELEGSDKPALMGPFKTSVAVGLMDYARERPPYLKALARKPTVSTAIGLEGRDVNDLDRPR